MYKNVPITAHEHIAGDFYLITIHNLEMASLTKPGQFYLITPYDTSQASSEFFLKRPISVFDVNQTEGEIVFYYQIMGKGTKSLSKIEVGKEISILGPLGRGFNTKINEQKVLLVGAGVGIAPFKYLYDELKKNNEVHILFAGRSKSALKITRYFDFPKNVYYCTDDGSLGSKENAVELTEQITEIHKMNPFSLLYGCGPNIVLKNLGKMAQKLEIPYQLSLEARMACGLRACMGCSIRTRDGMKKICSDGPVFNGDTLLLEEL